jgi:hypothetical protein
MRVLLTGSSGWLGRFLSERPEYPLEGLIEIDESYYGGRGKPESRGRGLTDPNKSLMAIAVETVPASLRQGEGIKKSRFIAGSARIAVLPSATAADLGGFVRGAAKRYERGSTIVTSNLPFDEWTGVFGSERLTGALLDRLTHHVHILEINGDSYRLKQSKQRQRQT